MKNLLKYFTVILVGSLFVSCASVQQRENKQISRAAFAISDSISHNRYDLAKKYSGDLNKLVAPIKDSEKVKIKNFHTDSKSKVQTRGLKVTLGNKNDSDGNFVVLPAGTDIKNIVVTDSPEYKQLLENNKKLSEQVAAEQKNFDNFQKKTQSILIDKQKEINKANSQSWISKIFSKFKLFFGVGLIGTIIILILVAIFLPAALPFILNILSLFWQLFVKLFNFFLTELNNILTEIVTEFKKIFNKPPAG